MTPEEAIKQLEFDRDMILFDPTTGEEITPEILKALNKDNFLTYFADGVAISALKEIQQYREIGTVEELKNSTREEGILKFYYCESEDDYYLGQRVENKYYARYGKTGFTWFMSRYLPWGEHVIAPNTLWKEYTYPSEPKEIPFFEWLQGFMKKYCGGTVEECREAVEKQKPKKPVLRNDNGKLRKSCPVCGCFFSPLSRSCPKCGQAILQENKDD